MQTNLPMKATMRLKDWTLRASHGAMTISGLGPDGQLHKVTQVKTIYRRQGEGAFGYGRHGRDDVRLELEEVGQ